ncbi:MAG: hypothetical protein MJ105_06625 [Lachnospiraceae bacterium]|nr:hypothetical protein [Lachnospiraceae bacterium]
MTNINTKGVDKSTVGKPQGGDFLGKADKTLGLIGTIIKDLKDISMTFERNKNVNADNAVKLSKATTEAQKENNRHIEELQRLEHEAKGILVTADCKNKRNALIKQIIDTLTNEIKNLEDKEGEEVASQRDKLNKDLKDITMELIRN